MCKDIKRKTKIVCTIGPASEKKPVLSKLVKAGMNVMRLNFSHGSHQEHLKKIENLQEINKELKTHVAILLDTKGPEIRTNDFVGGITEFVKGQQSIVSCEEDFEGTSERFSITYKNLYEDVSAGDRILVNDGQVELVIDKIINKEIYCTCQNDGKVKDKRGINVPGIKLGFEYLSKKDIDDLEFGCTQPISFVAASFARRAQDIVDIKKILVENGRNDIQIIAKIENEEGVENLDSILEIADGAMVARGDLGVEVPAAEVPLIQKKIIKKCKEKGKIVITATQMLESMQENPRPTRAEVSDVANAIFDGTDAIMLSGESASGKYPVESVETMDRISTKIEANLDYESLHRKAIRTSTEDTSEAICMSVAEIAVRFDVAAVIAFTQSGFTARKMSRYRLKAPIIAATPSEDTLKGLELSWGVNSVLCKTFDSRTVMLEYANVLAKEAGAKTGDMIIVTGGALGQSGMTSYLEIMTVK